MSHESLELPHGHNDINTSCSSRTPVRPGVNQSPLFFFQGGDRPLFDCRERYCVEEKSVRLILNTFTHTLFSPTLALFIYTRISRSTSPLHPSHQHCTKYILTPTTTPPTLPHPPTPFVFDQQGEEPSPPLPRKAWRGRTFSKFWSTCGS